MFIYNRQLTLLTFDRESAYLAGIKVNAFDLILYICLAVSIVLGVKILGIILISALLIIPPSTAKLVSASFKGLKFWSILFAEIIVLLGLIISYYFDLPTGAVIVLTGTVIFLIVFILKTLKFV